MSKFNQVRIDNFALEIKELWENTGKIYSEYYGNNQDILKYINTFDSTIKDYLLDIYYLYKKEFNDIVEYKYDGKNNYQSTKLKTLTTKYKKAIIKACGLEDSKKSFKQLPVCLIVNFDYESVKAYNLEYQKKINDKQTNTNRIDIKRDTIDKFINHCKDLLNEKSIYRKALSIAFFTGKRLYSEIFSNSKYIKLSNTRIRFYNLAKTNNHDKFTDVNLIGITSDIIIDNLNEIREYISLRNYDDIPQDELSKKLSPSINQYFYSDIISFFKKHEKNIELIKELKPHSLRSLHSLLSNETFNIDKNNRIIDYNYESLILGHFSFLESVNPLDLTKTTKDYPFKITNSTESYRKFNLIS